MSRADSERKPHHTQSAKVAKHPLLAFLARLRTVWVWLGPALNRTSDYRGSQLGSGQLQIHPIPSSASVARMSASEKPSS